MGENLQRSEILQRSRALKQALLSYVFDAEGELATALETFSAAHLAQSQPQDLHHRNLVIDRFLSEGKVGDKTPINLFIAAQGQGLTEDDRRLLDSWHRSFVGLFAVSQILPDGFELMNWLTAKRYTVQPNDPQTWEEMQRFKLGEILLTRIAPLTPEIWMFSGPCKPMGSLGKPKLAVAIGHFKQHYKESLYSDAPELLEAAWQSVDRYHQEFVEFFGGDEVTLSGYHLSKKISEFQAALTQKRLAEAGIDESKSLAELTAEAGIDAEEMDQVAATLGADAKAVATMLTSKAAASKMVTPKVELPPELKKAAAITVLADPRWGQMFLPTYTQFKALLESPTPTAGTGSIALVQKYLEDPAINAFVWHRLAAEHPQSLEQALRSHLDRPSFSLEQDLDPLLTGYHKPLEPELPEIASVPLHLNDLFQSALAEVSKSKPKDKSKPSVKKGFQRA